MSTDTTKLQAEWQAVYRKAQDDAAAAHKKHDALELKLRERTKSRMVAIDPGLGGEDFAHLAHNWYRCAKDDKANKAAIMDILDQYERDSQTLWRQQDREIETALAPMRSGYGIPRQTS